MAMFIFFLVSGSGRRKPGDDGVEQIAAPSAHGGRDRLGLAESEPVKIVDRQVVAEIQLVHREQHRASRAAQLLGHRLIHRMNPFPSVNHKQDEVRFGEGELDLAADRLVHDVAGIGDQSSGIDHPEVPAGPFGFPEVPVPRGTGVLGDDRVRPPRIRLKSVDFPTLGRPTIATVGRLMPPAPSSASVKSLLNRSGMGTSA